MTNPLTERQNTPMASDSSPPVSPSASRFASMPVRTASTPPSNAIAAPLKRGELVEHDGGYTPAKPDTYRRYL